VRALRFAGAAAVVSFVSKVLGATNLVGGCLSLRLARLVLREGRHVLRLAPDDDAKLSFAVSVGDRGEGKARRLANQLTLTLADVINQKLKSSDVPGALGSIEVGLDSARECRKNLPHGDALVRVQRDRSARPVVAKPAHQIVAAQEGTQVRIRGDGRWPTQIDSRARGVGAQDDDRDGRTGLSDSKIFEEGYELTDQHCSEDRREDNPGREVAKSSGVVA